MKKKFVSYLASLKFDPRLWNTPQAKYVTNIRLVILLILMIVVLGIFSYFQLPRRLNPELRIPIVIVNSVLPGASAADVESLLTVPLEEKMENIKGVDTLTSTSQEGVSIIVLQFLSSIDVDKAKNDVQSAVDSVSDLPTDATTPSVASLDFEDQPVWTFALTTKKDEATLFKFAQKLKRVIEQTPEVDRVATSGLEGREVRVLFDPVKLNELNINPVALSQLVSSATKSYPAGSLKTDQATYSFAIDKNLVSVEDVRNLDINVNGVAFKLGNLAVVTDDAKNDQVATFFANSQTPPLKTVQFFVYKTSTTNIDAAGSKIQKVVNERVKEENGSFAVQSVVNTGEEIDKQFKDLFGEFSSTMILVFINLLLFLGLRQAVISSITVPLTFLSTFFIINALGMSLNFLTMFAFLIALGLLIDDTIVTVAAMTRYYASKKFTPSETGLLVWRDFIVPLWSTTITTVWAFVPLLIASGIIGEFIKPIPIVVTSTLLSSTSIAVLITLPLMIVALKPQFAPRVKILLVVLALILLYAGLFFLLPKNLILAPIFLVFSILLIVTYTQKDVFQKKLNYLFSKNKNLKKVLTFSQRIIDRGLVDTEYLSQKYMVIIDKIITKKENRRKTLLALVLFSLFSYLLIPFGLVKNEFFPKVDEQLVYVNADLPSGSNLNLSERKLISTMSELSKTTGVEFLIGETGTKLDFQGSRSNDSGSFLITLHLLPKVERQISSYDVAEKLRQEFKNKQGLKLSVMEQSGGPPTGADLQIKLLGDDLVTLDSYADKIVNFLNQQQGVDNVEKSLKTGTGRLVFVPNHAKLVQQGLTVDAVALWLRTFASGFTLKSIKVNQEETDIVLKIEGQTRPEELGSLTVPTPQGGSVPLLSLGYLKLEANPTLITREDGKRSISVTATVTKGFVVTDKNKELETFAATLDLPTGYSWKTGGVNEENQESVQSIFQAMGISFLLILVTMVIEFKSYRQALMIMLLIPLSIAGVFYVFSLTGTPLSFPALIGVLALFGLVVTNGIVVIEKINDNRHAGMNLHDAIVDASGSRLEPILLTSITSILGLIPITIADPLWRGLGGAIIAGLLFSGAIKLFFVPVIYYMWYQGEERVREK